MWGKKGKKGDREMHTLDRGEVNAFLGGETSFEGKLNYSGAVRIDGRFKGEIYSEDTLVIGETAKVEGEIHVGNAIIQGEVVGNINAKEKVELHQPGKVVGNITTPALMIDDGAIFEGNCKMKEKKKEERQDLKGMGFFTRKKETEEKEEEKTVEKENK
jgi:cytoskeletal protein CcmA (bactofilin family)